jgi:hypothetical protein
MINFAFKDFNNTDEVISAVVTLDLLSKELNDNGYDFASKHLHKFSRDDLKFHVFTSFGDVTDVIIMKDEE